MVFYPVFLESAQWRSFFSDYHATARLGAKFKLTPDVPSLVRACTALMSRVRQHWPNVDTDGYRNIWIVKPVGFCRGVGVKVMESNLAIVDFVNRNTRNRYIVQKYLERPLLIYKTKFDIRQYFLLVGRAKSLQVWMYKSCYLKFSSQEFSLNNYHESVHLTNHCVQRNYTNSQNRNTLLPVCNMWSSDEFRAYLNTIDQPNAWTNKIYPSMKRNIVAMVRSTYDEGADIEPNCFELFGADFMLTESMESLLLEVNDTPDMAHSTPVTSVMCPQCLEDVVKVVVDRASNPKAPTGHFEMVYEIFQQHVQPHLRLTLPTKALRKPTPLFSSTYRQTSFTSSANSISSKSSSPNSRAGLRPTRNSSPMIRPSSAPKSLQTFVRPATLPKRSSSASATNKPYPPLIRSGFMVNAPNKRETKPMLKTNLDTKKPASPNETKISPGLPLLRVRNYVVPKTGLPGISREVARLIDLNNTIEQLLKQSHTLAAH